MTDKIKDSAKTEIQSILNNSLNLINKSNKQFEFQIQSQEKVMYSFLKSYQSYQKKFFDMQNLKNIIFWIGISSNFISLVFLTYFLFFR